MCCVVWCGALCVVVYAAVWCAVLCHTQVTVSSMKEAQELLRRAAKARQSSGTNANERSSRSHAVITVRGLAG